MNIFNCSSGERIRNEPNHEDSDKGHEHNLLGVDHHHLPPSVLLPDQVPLPQVWRWPDVFRGTAEQAGTQGETGRWWWDVVVGLTHFRDIGLVLKFNQIKNVFRNIKPHA